MLFNSFEFAIFMLIVYGLYLCSKHKVQNIILLIASYTFYAFWNWRFLWLLFFVTVVSYIAGLAFRRINNQKKRKWILFVAIGLQLLVLGFFKYFYFFANNIESFCSFVKLKVSFPSWSIILPLGISFFTFGAMGYVFDVYRRAQKPCRSFLDLALFVSFFTQLCAGPIERAGHLLPQIQSSRKINWTKFTQGTYLIFLGLFQKMFIADNMARIVNPVFDSVNGSNGADVLVAMYAFTFQLFCDFAGYSNMARGLGLIMGFDILVNFNTPFFAENVQEFWNRWHISLSLWIRDYVYFPLMGSLRKIKGNARIYVALFISMTLMGLWHGAAWNFVAFGVYYGFLLIAYLIIRVKWSKLIVPKKSLGIGLWFWSRVLFVFHLTVLGMMMFRCDSLTQVGTVLKNLVTNFHPLAMNGKEFLHLIGLAIPLMLLQFMEFKTKDIFYILKRHWLIRNFGLALMAYLLFGWGVMTSIEFIYFQF